MFRTTRAVLRYTCEDFRWMLPAILVLALFSEGLGLVASLAEEADIAHQLVLVAMLGFSALIDLILTTVYLNNQFTVFLIFSTTRRGLTAGILLHCLRMSLLQTASAFVLGYLDALVRRAVTGGTCPMPWEWIPWFVWLLVLLLPVWTGLFLGGVFHQFGAAGFWCFYVLFIFIIGCTNVRYWSSWAIRLLTRFSWPYLTAWGVVVFLVLTVLSVYWLQRAKVK